MDLVDEVAHAGEERFSTVLITPAIDGWTSVIGAWCGLPYLTRSALVTKMCQQLSWKRGRADAYFHSEQNHGEAWLIAKDGGGIRRWIAEYPELVLGEPFGVERQLLDAFGIPGKPEDLDPEDDRASGWAATWGDCDAPEGLRRVEPGAPADRAADRRFWSGARARTPPLEPLKPITGTASYRESPGD